MRDRLSLAGVLVTVTHENMAAEGVTTAAAAVAGCCSRVLMVPVPGGCVTRKECSEKASEPAAAAVGVDCCRVLAWLTPSDQASLTSATLLTDRTSWLMVRGSTIQYENTISYMMYVPNYDNHISCCLGPIGWSDLGVAHVPPCA